MQYGDRIGITSITTKRRIAMSQHNGSNGSQQHAEYAPSSKEATTQAQSEESLHPDKDAPKLEVSKKRHYSMRADTGKIKGR